jgi:lysophospholipase L1-like esterase
MSFGTSSRRTKQKRSIASSAVSIGSNVLGAAGLLLVSQALYIAITTPRLPSPDNSGHDFDEEGLIAYYKDEEGEADSNAKNAPEFRLVLLGDSPVEGIGNDSHAEALGGQTALEFSKLLKRPVRYWSYGKTGLTAQGVKEEMLPHLKILSKKCGVDAVVVSCGVNNTLGGYSPQTFGREVRELLCSIRLSCPATRILMMELLDFELLPFIPYPLSKIASWRSRGLRREMESIVNDFKNKDQCGGTEMAYMPRIEELLGRRDECSLLNHLSHEERHALTLADFFADDNFHPANIGNTIVGKILAETYTNLINK